MQKWHEVLREELHLYPGILSEKCTGCKNCVVCCKEHVIAYDEGLQKCRVATPDRCRVDCRTCARVCPVGAVTFPDEEAFIFYLRQRLAKIEKEMDRLENTLHDGQLDLH